VSNRDSNRLLRFLALGVSQAAPESRRKAIRATHAGDRSVLQLEDIAQPQPGPSGAPVRVHAAGVNFADVYRVTVGRESWTVERISRLTVSLTRRTKVLGFFSPHFT
jgi:hypothetical protein